MQFHLWLEFNTRPRWLCKRSCGRTSFPTLFALPLPPHKREARGSSQQFDGGHAPGAYLHRACVYGGRLEGRRSVIRVREYISAEEAFPTVLPLFQLQRGAELDLHYADGG